MKELPTCFVLESKIYVDSAAFHSITRELDSCPTLQGLATRLRSELEVIKVERSERRQEALNPRKHGFVSICACFST